MKITPRRVGLAAVGIAGVVLVGSVALDQDTYPTPAETPASEWTVRPPLATAPATAVPKPKVLTVVAVVDGDTFKLSDGRTVRALGIDTPETKHPDKPVGCYGPEASAFAKDTLEGETVRLETDPSQDVKDRYGRTLGYLFVGDVNYGQLAIGQGMATEYTYDGGYKYQTLYRNTQTSAKNAGNGLWSACPAVVPTEEAPAGTYFVSCAAAREAGAAPLRKGDPGYRSGLDRDGDGTACEG